MKKFLFLAVSAALFALSASAATRVVKLKEFNSLRVSASANVEYVVTQTDAPTVTVTGENEVIKHLSVKMTGKTLTIGYENLSGRKDTRKVRIVLTAPAVPDMAASSSAEIDVKGAVNFPDATVQIAASSSADINIPSLVAAYVNIAASSSADVEVKNIKADKCNVSASSSADVELKCIKVTELNLAASSSADMDVEGIDAEVLNVAASSSADVELAGTVSKSTAISATSGADVSKKNLKSSSWNVVKSSGGKVY